MEPEERFKAMKMVENESAIAFIKRLETSFKDLFGANALGETRRISEQFLENYSKEGIKLDVEEKRCLYTCNNLIDVAIFATRAIERQKENLNWQKSQYQTFAPLEPQINFIQEYPQFPIPRWGNRDIEPNAQDISHRMLIPSVNIMAPSALNSTRQTGSCL